MKHKIHTMREVMIPPFETTVVKGIVNLTTHSKCLSVVVEPAAGIQNTLLWPDCMGY